MLDVPAVAMDDDLLVGLLARKHRRQHDAVVIDPRLAIEDGHVILAGCRLQQMLPHAPRRHALPDDAEFLCHCSLRHAPRPPNASPGSLSFSFSCTPPSSSSGYDTTFVRASP